MEVNEALVDKLAHLSRLEFSAEEKSRITEDLQRMIFFVEKISELDLTDVRPLIHMSDEINALREDEVTNEVGREIALKNAPVKDKQFFRVPKVIRK